MAAVRAAMRALPVMEPGKSLRFASPPDGKDPDDLAREGGLEAVNAMVDAAVPLIDIIWRDLTARFNLRDPDQRAALSAELKRLLATLKNSDVREAYANALRELYRGGGPGSNAAGRGLRRAARKGA